MPNNRYGVNIANIAYVWEQRKLGEVVERVTRKKS